MPRVARIVVPGHPHHVTQRGNNRQDVFFVDDDRQAYIGLLKKECAEHGLSILGWCLMPNHVHLVAVPHGQDALAKAIGRTDWRYAQYVGRLHHRSGHLWQNRFFSCVLEGGHLVSALAYVDRNPVRAGMVRRPWDYAWSSARAHVEGRDPAGLLHMTAWRRLAGKTDWRSLLVREGDHDRIRGLRDHTRTGRPLGSDAFLAKLERALGHRLRSRPAGRPRKRPTGSARRPNTDRDAAE